MFVPVPFFVLVNYKSWSCFAQFPSRSVLTVWGCKTSWLKWTDPQLPHQCAHGSWLVCKMFHTNNQVELYEWSAYLWHFTSHTWQEWMCKATCKTQANRKSSESRSMGSTWIWLQARWSQVGRSVSELRTAACFFLHESCWDVVPIRYCCCVILVIPRADDVCWWAWPTQEKYKRKYTQIIVVTKAHKAYYQSISTSCQTRHQNPWT